MLKNETVLGTKRTFGEVELVQLILTKESSMMPIGTPVLSAVGGESSRGKVPIYVVFSPNISGSTRRLVLAPSTCLENANIPAIDRIHSVLDVESFVPEKIARLVEYVQDVGAITLISSDDTALTAAATFVKEIGRQFKYKGLFSYSPAGPLFYSRRGSDVQLAVVSLFALRYCIPIFNPRKVDGIGVRYCHAAKNLSEERGTLDSAFRFEMVYSNHLDNVFEVDGCRINTEGIHLSLYRDMESLSTLRIKQDKKDKNTQPAKEKEVKLYNGGEIKISFSSPQQPGFEEWVTEHNEQSNESPEETPGPLTFGVGETYWPEANALVNEELSLDEESDIDEPDIPDEEI